VVTFAVGREHEKRGVGRQGAGDGGEISATAGDVSVCRGNNVSKTLA